MTASDDTTEYEEPRYMVRVAIAVDGADPGEAARNFATYLMEEGLGHLTYTVEDRADDEYYVATLDGNYTTVDMLIQELEGEGNVWIEPIGIHAETDDVIGPFRSELDASDHMDAEDLDDDDWKIVVREDEAVDLDALILAAAELTEAAQEPPVEPVKQGTCKRCGEQAELGKGKLCEPCRVDIKGGS